MQEIHNYCDRWPRASITRLHCANTAERIEVLRGAEMGWVSEQFLNGTSAHRRPRDGDSDNIYIRLQSPFPHRSDAAFAKLLTCWQGCCCESTFLAVTLTLNLWPWYANCVTQWISKFIMLYKYIRTYIRTDNAVPVDLSSKRGSGSLRGRDTQLPRHLVVNRPSAHHHIYRTGTTLCAQALLHRQSTCLSQ